MQHEIYRTQGSWPTPSLKKVEHLHSTFVFPWLVRICCYVIECNLWWASTLDEQMFESVWCKIHWSWSTPLMEPQTCFYHWFSILFIVRSYVPSFSKARMKFKFLLPTNYVIIRGLFLKTLWLSKCIEPNHERERERALFPITARQ